MENYSEVLHYFPISSETIQAGKFYSKFPVHSSKIDIYDQQASYLTRSDDEDDVKRPMNSFLLWAKIMRRKYAHENPNLHNAEVSKLLGKIWNSMTVKDKRPFVEKAEKLRILHMRTYPNYRYAPKKRKEKRTQRTISPEIAAALQSTICDVKSIISGQLSKKNSMNDLKSYGYLKNVYENGALKKWCEDKNSSMVDLKESLAEKASNKEVPSPTLETLNEEKPIEIMTLHYYPTHNADLKTPSQPKQWGNPTAEWNAKTFQNNKVLKFLNEQENKSDHVAECCALPRKMYNNSNIANVSYQENANLCQPSNNLNLYEIEEKLNFHVSVESVNNIKSPVAADDSSSFSSNTCSEYTDNLTIDETIEDELPEFLQKLINRPLHHANSTISDDISLWADIDNIISNETSR